MIKTYCGQKTIAGNTLQADKKADSGSFTLHQVIRQYACYFILNTILGIGHGHPPPSSEEQRKLRHRFNARGSAKARTWCEGLQLCLKTSAAFTAEQLKACCCPSFLWGIFHYSHLSHQGGNLPVEKEEPHKAGAGL